MVLSLIQGIGISQARIDTINIGGIRTLDTIEEGGFYNFYLQITQVGQYTVEVNFPSSVSRGAVTIVNDVGISIEGQYVGVGFPLGNGYYYPSSENDGGSMSVDFLVLQVPNGNVVGLNVEYSANRWHEVDDNSGSIIVEYSRSSIPTGNSATITLNLDDANIDYWGGWIQERKTNFLPAISSSGLYNVSLEITGPDADEISGWVSLTSVQLGQSASAYSDGGSDIAYFNAGQDILVEFVAEIYVDGYGYNNTPPVTGQRTATLTVSVNPLADDGVLTVGGSKSVTFTDPYVVGENIETHYWDSKIFKMPSISSPLKIMFEAGENSFFEARLLTSLDTDYIGNYNSEESGEVALLKMPFENNIEYNIEGLVYPIPNIDNLIENLVVVSKEKSEWNGYNEINSYLSQNVGFVPNLIGNDTYLEVRGVGTAEISITSFTPKSLTSGSENVDSIIGSSISVIYELTVPEESEVLTFSGSYELHSGVAEGEFGPYVNQYAGINIVVITPQGPVWMDLEMEGTPPFQTPILSTGTYYVIPDVYVDTMIYEISNPDSVNTDAFGVTLTSNITLGLAAEIEEGVTGIYDLGSIGYAPTSQVGVINIEKDHVYKIFLDVGPFSSLGDDVGAWAFAAFIGADSSYPFREPMPMFVGFGITEFGFTVSAREDTKVYAALLGRGMVNMTIVDIGDIDVEDIPNLEESPPGFIAAPGIVTLLSSFIAIYAFRRRK